MTYRCSTCNRRVKPEAVIMSDDPEIHFNEDLKRMRETMDEFWRKKGKPENISSREMKLYHRISEKYKPLGLCHGYRMRDALCGPLREEDDYEYYLHWIGYERKNYINRKPK